MSFDDLIRARLENVRTTSDGWTAACPACRAQGADKQGNHLRIWRHSNAFNCAKAGPEDREHNKVVRAILYQDADPDTLASLDLQIIDPEPKLEVEKVYPDEWLTRLVPDHRYWINRGISEEVLRRMEGGLAPPDEKSKLSGRYVLPIRDEKHRIVGWTGRLVSDASFGPKWKHLCKASKVVYPIHVTGDAIRATQKVVLVESPGDGMSLASGAGMWNWLILLGLNLNARVLGLLVSVNPTHIIISTNADTERVNKVTGAVTHPGQDAANKLRAKLIPFFGEERVIVRFPPAAIGKDWNEILLKAPDELAAFKAEIDAL
jgi:hypothetical protein